MNSGLISVNTVWDLSREHWWNLINFESILFLYCLIVCLSKIPSLPLQMESWTQYLGGCIFSCSIGNCIFFFSISFLIFWNSIHLTHVSQLGNEDLVDDYIFTSQRESHSLPDMDFCYTFNFLSHKDLLRIDLPKLTSSILMEIVTISVVLVDEFYFYMHHPIKAWIFEKLSLS